MNSTFKHLETLSGRLMKILLARVLDGRQYYCVFIIQKNRTQRDEPPARSFCCFSTSRTHGGVIHLKISPHTDGSVDQSTSIYANAHTDICIFIYIYVCIACGNAQLQGCSAASYIIYLNAKL